MNWQPEYKNMTDLKILSDLFRNYKNIHIRPAENLIYNGIYASDSRSTPFLGDVRGKVVLIKCVGGEFSDYCNDPRMAFGGSSAFSSDTNLNNWEKVIPSPCVPCPPCSCTSSAFKEKVECNVLSRYKPYVRTLTHHIGKAGAKIIQDKFYMTWVSYSPVGDACREKVGNLFNELLVARYENNTVDINTLLSTGIVIMDFPKIEYIENIISFNFQGKYTSNYIYYFMKSNRL